MFDSLRREYAHLVTSGGELLLLVIGVYTHTRKGWLICLALMATVALFAWLSALARLRAIRNTPTSKIASAAQGYVELIGHGYPTGGDPLFSQLSRRPCLWCRYKVERRGAKDEWEVVDSGETMFSFVLRDDTGECLVDPEQAEIETQHYQHWAEGNERYSEWLLLHLDAIYVIGHFRTEGGCTTEFNKRAAMNDLLNEWKKDMPALRALRLEPRWRIQYGRVGGGQGRRRKRGGGADARSAIRPRHARRHAPAGRQAVSAQQPPGGLARAPLPAVVVGAPADFFRRAGRVRLGVVSRRLERRGAPRRAHCGIMLCHAMAE
jgi:hypothetical protein